MSSAEGDAAPPRTPIPIANRPETDNPVGEHLEPDDAFDRLVLEFRDQAGNDDLPTQSDYKFSISLMRQDSWDSAGMFLQDNKGFVAAAAYPFKPWVKSSDLMVAGARALMAAARTYDLESEEHFSDYALVSMRRLLAQTYPEAPVDDSDFYDERPMERLLYQVSHMQSRPEAEAIARHENAERQLSSLTPGEREILPYIHLHGHAVDADDDIPFSADKIYGHVYNAVNRLGLNGREELALLALDAGLAYKIKAPKGADKLTVRQRMVSTRLHMPNAAIGEELGLSESQVGRSVRQLFIDTGAKTRTELLLMARIHGFEPSAEELYVHNHEAMQEFTEFQRPIVALAHLRTKEIADRLKLPEGTVNDAIAYVTSGMGLKGRNVRTSLVLALHERGFRFDVREPLQPLPEILTARELRIGHMATSSNKEIAEAEMTATGATGISRQMVNRWMHRIQTKTGARSRAEMALQIRMYDTGESRPVFLRSLPRHERFFREIGVEPVPMEEAYEWLQHVTPRQREILAARYFSEEQLSVDAIARRFSVTRSTIVHTSSRGLRNIGKALLGEGEA